jgi:hypothetical protein
MKKTCAKCRKQFPATSEFFYNLKGKGFHSYCKKCNSTVKVEHNRKIKLLAIGYLGGKCKKCSHKGEPCDFDFHHLNPDEKEFNIGKNKNVTFDNIKKELDKCILLCAICHRRLHAGLIDIAP